MSKPTITELYEVNWHKIKADKMPLILRNLAPINPFNPCQLWPQTDANAPASLVVPLASLALAPTKKKANKKAAKPKKADVIRAQLAKDQELKKQKLDEEKLSNAKTVSLMSMAMSTPAGRLKQLYEMLKDFYKKKAMLDAVDTLWEIQALFDLSSSTYEEIHKKNAKYVTKIQEFLAAKEVVAFQLNEMADRLPPLNLHHTRSFILDDWQKQVLSNIDKKESMIVCAPTSSGKTVLSSYVSVIGGQVLFVVPSEPLAWQVAALFHAMLKGHVMLVTPSNVYKPEAYRIVVGTPQALESVLLDIGTSTFEYAVFDEVHDLNGAEGDALERIIKLVSCPFLALSATIGNAPVLQAWWQSHHPQPVKLMEYSGRFINLQRLIWQPNAALLQVLHPCAALTLQYLINDGFVTGDLAFTPKDTYALWRAMQTAFSSDLVADLDPVVYFPTHFPTSKRMTLLQSKTYEDAMKTRLGALARTHGTQTQQVLTSFHPTTLTTGTSESSIELWPLVQTLCTQSLVPAIAFQLNATRCRQLFDTLLANIESAEELKYPSYKAKLVKEMEDWEKNSKKNAASAAKAKQKEEENRDAQDFDEVLPPDVFAPHPDFILTPMGFRLSALEFKEIKWQLRYELSEHSEDGHALVRSLRRGLGLYLQGLPAAYLRVVQTLAQAGRLALVLSDTSLAYGVNMPFRTCIFAEDSGPDILTALMVQQMAGRAGRRGLDRQGNIVFTGMTWDRIQTLMRGLLPDVVGAQESRVPTLALGAYCSDKLSHAQLVKMTSFPLYHFVHQTPDPMPDYLTTATNWCIQTGLLTDASTLAVSMPVARLVWECRDTVSESLALMHLLPLLDTTFKHSNGELVGPQMGFFNLLARVLDARPWVESNSTAALAPLNDYDAAWTATTTIMATVAQVVPSLDLAVPEMKLDPFDGSVMLTLIDNRIPIGLSTQELNTIKQRLLHLGNRLRLMHNLLQVKAAGTYQCLEVITRKCFRRIKWILIDAEV